MIRVLTFILFLCLTTTASQGQVIGEIQVEGTKTSDPAEVLKVIKTKVGVSLQSQLTQRSISEDLTRISELERYDPLSLRVETRGSETLKTLVFIVKEYPVVSDIRYSGNTKYKKKAEETDAGVVLEFAIEEGRKLKLQSVGFEGNTAFTDDTLRKHIQTKPKLLHLFRKKFDNEQFQKDIKALEYYYQQHGFLEAKVSEGTRKLVKDDRRLDVNFDISEGPQYRLGKVVIEGASIFDRSDILHPLTVQRGEILDRPRLVQNLQDVRSLYWNQGYRLVDIEPEIIPDRETGVADLFLRVNEGQRLRLRNVQIKGVGEAADHSTFDVPMETKDYVVEREFELEEGDVLDWSKIEETERKLVNLQFFETQEGAFPPKLKHGFQLEPIPGTREADLLLQLEETNTGFIQLGGGFSTDYGASLNFEFKDRNAFGRAWSYSFAADVGSKRQSVSLTFFNPHLNNTDYTNRYGVYYRRTDKIGGKDFSEKRIGGTVAVGRQLPKRSMLRSSTASNRSSWKISAMT
ncbi:MAG: BamA/TamA family outer membrane protein [Candidatus Omnitrophica bacterium]|nr:BamA/TamA family outer membrane protein [Candidatus Omnitrophota bacterium]